MNQSPMITSRDNPLVKRARAVRDGKLRELIFVEGVRLCEEAAQAPLDIQDVLYTTEFVSYTRGASLLDMLSLSGARLHEVSENVLDSMADTKTPQGIILLATRPDAGAPVLGPQLPLVIILHRLSNPSNAGAILRTAEAAGATAAVATEGTTDIFSPKALRGAMGSSFRLPVWAGASFNDTLDWCTSQGILTTCADAQATRAHTEIDWTTPRALIVGEEGAGLTDEEVAAADEALRIPMRPPVESLNVAIASAIILYEAARQRAD